MRRACMVVANPFVHDSRVLKEAGTLVARGWKVTVVAAMDAGLPSREKCQGIDVVRVPREPVASRLAKALLRRRPGLGEEANRQSFAPRGPLPPAELAARRFLESLTHARFWRRATLALARCGADVIVAHDLDALPPARLVAWLRGVPLVYDSHELFLEMPPILPRTASNRRRWMAAERRLARSSDLVITVSDGIADQLARRYGIARPLVIRNVPVLVRDRATAEAGLRETIAANSSTRIVVYVGGIRAGRGLEQLVAAVQLLPDAVLAFVGPGDSNYIATLVSVGAGRIRVLPPVPSADVAAFVRTADVGVVPYRNLSLNHYLALPTKLFEYLGAGLPVVSPDFPEIRNVVLGRGVGETCDTDDPASVADAIERVLANGEALRKNVARAASELNWRVEGARYADAFERVLAARLS